VPRADELIQEYFAVPADSQAELLLDRLLREHADPIIKNAIRRWLWVDLDFVWRLDARAPAGAPGKTRKELSAEDLYSRIVLYLVTHLRARREATDAEPIRQFGAYVRQLAANAYREMMRRQFPARHHVRRKLLEMAPEQLSTLGLALHRDERSGAFLGALRHWQGETPPLARRDAQWLENPGAFRNEGLLGDDPATVPFPNLVARALDWAGAPMHIDDLTQGLSQLSGFQDVRTDVAADDEDLLERLDAGVHLEEEVVRDCDQGAFVRALWQEVASLPLIQRRAFVLRREKDEIQAFVRHGSCDGRRQIALLLELPWEEFEACYRALPLPYDRIGQRLGLTQREAINRQKIALERLRRRLQDWEPART
jgi:hypothetical protein